MVLSHEEVARLIAACKQSQAPDGALAAYATGLRASEVVSLKVSDVDSGRMTLRVEQQRPQGSLRDALALLLERLRDVWWRSPGRRARCRWRLVVPGLNLIESLSPRQLNRAVQAAALAAGIDKRVSMHTLRHYSVCRTTLRRINRAHRTGRGASANPA